jgi:hypothetical protein
VSLVRKKCMAILSPLVLSSCASTQLNYNTVELSSSLDDVYTRETLNNLSKFVDNYYAIPSQMVLSGGVFQTVNTVNPSMSVPIADQLAKTATGVVTGAASSVTNTRVNTLAGSGATLSATNTQQQNYTVAPLNDQLTLLNQQALYQHAVYKTDLNATYTPPRVFINGKFFYDPFALREPQCILCYKDQGETFTFDPVHPIPRKDLKVNRRLETSSWLLHDVAPTDELKDLGHFGNHELLMRKSDFENGVLTNFVLATLSYASPTESFAVVTVPPPTPAPPAGPGSAPAAPQIFVPPAIVPPANNYRVLPSDRPGLNLVIPQQIQP